MTENEWVKWVRKDQNMDDDIPTEYDPVKIKPVPTPRNLKASVELQSARVEWKDPHRRKIATTARGSTTRYNVATNSNQLQDNTNACTESKEQDSNPEAQ